MIRIIISLTLSMQLMGCGSYELGVDLNLERELAEPIVWVAASVYDFSSATPTFYPAQRLDEGPFLLPLPEVEHPFVLRVDACGEGPDCDVHSRIAAGCSTLISVHEGQRERISVTLVPVSLDLQGCPLK